jgi:DNA-binding transcriptional ArsR family regulator
VWTRIDVMTEMVAASHRWRAPHRVEVLGGWAKRTMADLGSLAPSVMRDVRSGAFQYMGLGLGIFPDRNFDQLVDGSLLRPTSQWRHVIRIHRSRVPFPIQPGLAEGRPAAMNAVSESLRHFHRAAIVPYWDQLSRMAAACASEWINTLSTRGVAALFNELHPTVSWHEPILSIGDPGTRFCDPSCFHHKLDPVEERVPVSCRGLTIMPTVFRDTCETRADFDPVRGWAMYYLAVPVPATWQWFEIRAPSDTSDALGDLLGLTRSWVLQACLDASPTTSQLAQAVGISVSSASEHAAVLRAAGLLRSERRANRVVHQATPIGALLIRSSDRPRSDQAQLDLGATSMISTAARVLPIGDHRTHARST